MDKLFSFIKTGYFSVLKRYEEYTVVSFYETIAIINDDEKHTPVRTAKIYFNDRFEVMIIPYDAPPELRANYNKE